jgi:hypothetical protein
VVSNGLRLLGAIGFHHARNNMNLLNAFDLRITTLDDLLSQPRVCKFTPRHIFAPSDLPLNPCFNSPVQKLLTT